MATHPSIRFFLFNPYLLFSIYFYWLEANYFKKKNIQATTAAQFQKNKWPNQKMGQITKQTFLQRRHTDC